MSRFGSIIARLVDHVLPEKSHELSDRLTQEQEEEAADIFKFFDADGDGLVTKFELKEALWSLGQHLADDEMGALLQAYDSNEDGSLCFAEFRRLLADRLAYKNTREEFLEAFRAIDHNRDGSLDVGEVKRLMAITECGLDDREVHEIFDMFDKNGNGKVDLEEFMKHMMGA